MRLLNLSTFCLICLFVACGKHNDPAPPTPPPPTPPTPPTPVTINVHLTRNSKAYLEYIFSEPGGKILLDTIGRFDDFSATLTSSQKLVDLTYVSMDTVKSTYSATTFKGVDIGAWTTSGLVSYTVTPSSVSSTITATIVYTNVPNVSFTGMSMSANPISGLGPGAFTHSGNTMKANYSLSSTDNYLYLVMPDPGLYHFHKFTRILDTVDLSKMDTAVKITYNHPSGITGVTTQLIGVMDTTNIDRQLLLYFWNTTNPGGLPDVVYPTKQVQKQELQVRAATSNSDLFFYNYGDKPPTTLPWPDANFITLNSSSGSAFSVKWGSTPSLYSAGWNNTKITYRVYASGDSTSLNTEALLTSLHSKTLQGQTLTGFKLTDVTVDNVPGMSSIDFTTYRHSNLARTKRISQAISHDFAF
ncbi:MAG: hypothetical protein JST68_13980 [Bacteroidetes bacterium]|nr:hypothetical protein [Bacteroidota bacterium]